MPTKAELTTIAESRSAEIETLKRKIDDVNSQAQNAHTVARRAESNATELREKLLRIQTVIKAELKVRFNTGVYQGDEEEATTEQVRLLQYIYGLTDAHDIPF